MLILFTINFSVVVIFVLFKSYHALHDIIFVCIYIVYKLVNYQNMIL